MGMPDRAAAVLAKAEAGGVQAAEMAALRRRVRQLGERRAGFLPGEVRRHGWGRPRTPTSASSTSAMCTCGMPGCSAP